MFGINKGLSDLLLGQIKTKIKSEGIKFIVAIPDEQTGELNVRAFKEKMYFITNEMFESIVKKDETLSKIITKINTPTDEK